MTTEDPIIGRPVRAAEVTAIAALDDPVVRNLWITHAYHEWGVALAKAMGDDDVSWCAFGTWASKSAGRTIRGEDLPGVLQDALAHSENLEPVTRRVGRVSGFLGHLRLTKQLERSQLFGLADRVADEISAKIAEGNLLVFAELGPILAGVVEAFERRPAPAAGDHDAVVGPLLAAVPAGVDPALLEQALAAWWKAAFATDSAARSQLVLEGNIAAVLHEQQRLQDAIAGALDAAITDGVDRVVDDVIDTVAFARPLSWVLHRMLNDLTAELEEGWRHLVTEELTTLATPDEVLHLGHDLPALAGVAFPPTLVMVSDPGVTALWDAWNRARPDLGGTAAHDWSVLTQRMNYIVNLFRSRQCHVALLQPPYTDAQLALMAQGKVPLPPL